MIEHPGAYLNRAYLKPLGLTAANLSQQLLLGTRGLDAILEGKEPVTAMVAVRLEAVLAESATKWLQMQTEYDIFRARAQTDVVELKRYNRLDDLWKNGIPKTVGIYLWREAEGHEELCVELFFPVLGSQEKPAYRCRTKSDFTFMDERRGQWRIM